MHKWTGSQVRNSKLGMALCLRSLNSVRLGASVATVRICRVHSGRNPLTVSQMSLPLSLRIGATNKTAPVRPRIVRILRIASASVIAAASRSAWDGSVRRATHLASDILAPPPSPSPPALFPVPPPWDVHDSLIKKATFQCAWHSGKAKGSQKPMTNMWRGTHSRTFDAL